ncbi:MAG: nicotinate-nucleotide adenylyltransferase [Sedimenticola sp.]
MIGILGGTFDPIHNAHLRTALDVLQALQLDEVCLIPLRQPPHRESPLLTPQQRLELVQLAVAGNPLFKVDDRELKRKGDSYTVDTLLSLRQELGDQPICLLMGTDAFRGFPDWHKPEEILKLAHLVIMQRPGEKHPPIYPDRTTTAPQQLRKSPGGLIFFQPVTQLAISATAIREQLQQGRSPRYLLPDAVLDIIEKKQLYR